MSLFGADILWPSPTPDPAWPHHRENHYPRPLGYCMGKCVITGRGASQSNVFLKSINNSFQKIILYKI